MTMSRQQAARASYAEDLNGDAWADLRRRLAATARGRRCAVDGRRCRGGARQAHHWSRSFYATPIVDQHTWMLVPVCCRAHRIIHALSWVSAGGRDRVTWLPFWTGVVVGVGKTLQLVRWAARTVARGVAR
jgi:hypothetical protein